MSIKAETPEQYIEQLTDERKIAVSQLRKVILGNIPKGFSETISYGMIGFVVPHSIYPNGYHCDPKQPLPFISIASQKNYIALYHTAMYGDTELTNWFREQYPKHCKTKLDMGKGCIRFKKIEQIPYDLIAELSGKMSTDEWIKIYETNIKR